MIDSLQLYFNNFRQKETLEDDRKLSYLELLGISWSLHLIYAFYTVFALYLSAKSYSYLSSSENFGHLALESLSFKVQKTTLLTALFTVIFYPFIFQCGYKFWKGTFKFFANIFDYEDSKLDDKADEILNTAFTSNLFLIFPIIGNFLSNIALIFFIFRGLKEKYEFSSLQAGLVIISPLFLVFLFAVFTASYFVFLFTLI